MSQYAPELLELDVTNVDEFSRAMEIIHDDEGPLARQAGGNSTYLEYLRDCAVAEVSYKNDPLDPDKLKSLRMNRLKLTVYEADILGRNP